MDFAFIPSPSHGVIHLGPLPLRGYAFCIIIGVFVAVWLGGKRWIARGGKAGTVADIAVWAVPFGLVGGRLYHVITDYELYFTNGKDWVDAFKIWQGGLGIWGAIALGALGAWIGCRRRGIALPVYADAIAPGIALAQAVGRWGNWFNQELFGKPTHLPWGLKIDAAHRPEGTPNVATYQPTFLYESLWCVGVALLVIWADRRFRLGHGRAFALYVASYTVGRFWIEYLRVDDAHHVLGLRLNDWTAIVVFAGAVLYFILSARWHPGREEIVEPDGRLPVAADAVADGGTLEPAGAVAEGSAALAAAGAAGGSVVAADADPEEGMAGTGGSDGTDGSVAERTATDATDADDAADATADAVAEPAESTEPVSPAESAGDDSGQGSGQRSPSPSAKRR